MRVSDEMKTGDESRPTVSVVIPAYNEAGAIGETVKTVLSLDADFQVIVVDDGSRDETARLALEAGAQVISHPYNVGNGASIKHGAMAAQGEVVVFLDSDGQHPANEIPKLLKHMDKYDMVVGSRTDRCSTSKVRNLGNKMLNRLARWISGHQIDDLTSGFRAVRRSKLLEFLYLFPNRYSYPTTITLALLGNGDFIKYVPLDNVAKRESGKSDISPMGDFFRFLHIILRMVMLFAPMRIFLPASIFCILIGCAVGIFQLAFTGGIHATAIILIVCGVIMFCFGMLAEQLTRLRAGRS